MRGRALSIVLSGHAIAAIAGVPIGIFLSHLFFWRMSYVFIAVLGACAAGGIVWWLPCVPTPAIVPLRERLRVCRDVPILLTLLVTTVCQAGSFVIYTFLSPIVLGSTLLTEPVLAIAFLVYGVGSLLSTTLGGIFTDRSGPRRVTVLSIAAIVICFGSLSAIFSFTPSLLTTAVALGALFAWGALGWMFNPAQAYRLVQLDPDNAALTLSANGSAVHAGVALGSLCGGFTLHFGPTGSLGAVAAGIECLGLLLIWVSWRSRPGRLA